MSERTFRAVVAAVLVGALILAAVVVLVILQPSSPGPTPTVRPTPTARPTTPPPTVAPTPTPTPPIVFGEVEVTAVGNVPRGGASGATLVLRFVESSVDAIPGGAGAFTVTLADSAGAGATLAFTGTPSVEAPGWMGATAEVTAANVLTISIAGADRSLLEQLTVTGLGMGASREAALGPIGATLGAFSGSLAGGVANPVVASPGTVVAGP